MTPKTKKIVIVGGSLLVIVSIIGYALWKHKKSKEDALKNTSETSPEINTNTGDVSEVLPKNSSTTTISSSVPKSTGTKGSTVSPIDLVLKNLGISAKKVQDTIVAPFNSNKNFAVFYTNGRVIIFDTATKKRLKAGSYSDGGKIIKLDTGKTLNSNSVWNNLGQTLK